MPDSNKPTDKTVSTDQPPTGPAPGQKPQTTAEPGRTTVATPKPLHEAKSQDEADKIANDSLNPPSPSSSVGKSPEYPSGEDLQTKLDALAEQALDGLDSLASDPTSIVEAFINRLRRRKNIGAAPLRHTSGGSPLENLDRARAEGKAPIQGSF